jgi:MFS family permease
MSALYWFALVVGAGLLILSLAGDLFGDHGDGAIGDGHDHDGDPEGMKILSMRNATYFLFGFGGAGILLSWLWDRSQPLATALSALVVGLMSGGISALAFGYLSRTGSGELERDSAWSGAIGRVLLPLSRDGTGKIIVARAGREHTLLARPFEPDARDPESWQAIVIVEMRHGIALVTPFTSTLEAPELPRLTDNTER